MLIYMYIRAYDVHVQAIHISLYMHVWVNMLQKVSI